MAAPAEADKVDTLCGGISMATRRDARRTLGGFGRTPGAQGNRERRTGDVIRAFYQLAIL